MFLIKILNIINELYYVLFKLQVLKQFLKSSKSYIVRLPFILMQPTESIIKVLKASTSTNQAPNKSIAYSDGPFG